MSGYGFEHAFGGLYDTHGILTGDELVFALHAVLIATRQTGKDDGLFSMYQVAAVEFSAHVYRKAAAAQGFRCIERVGSGRKEIASHGKKDPGLALVHGFDGSYYIISVRPGRGEAKILLNGVQELVRRALPDAYRTIALHIAMTAYGAGARAGLADAAFQQQEIDDLLYRVHRIPVLRKPHGPAYDDLLFVF